jgi:hypothetical protein
MIQTILRLLSLILTTLRLRSERALENLAAPPAARRFKSTTPAAETPEVGPILLASPVPILGALERDTHHRQA